MKLIQIAPTVESVNDLESIEAELVFIKAFRYMMRVKNVLTFFSDFNLDDLVMDEQQFEDYKSKCHDF